MTTATGFTVEQERLHRWVALTFGDGDLPPQNTILLEADTGTILLHTVRGILSRRGDYTATDKADYADLSPLDPDKVKIYRCLRNGTWTHVWIWGQEEDLRFFAAHAIYKDGRYRTNVRVHPLTGSKDDGRLLA